MKAVCVCVSYFNEKYIEGERYFYSPSMIYGYIVSDHSDVGHIFTVNEFNASFVDLMEYRNIKIEMILSDTQ